MTFQRFFIVSIAGLGLNLAVLGLLSAQIAEEVPIYLDRKQPIERRVEDLLGRMSLKEKLGQLNMPCVYLDELGKDIPTKLAACKRFAEGTYTDEIGPGGGFFTLADRVLLQGARQQAEYFNQLQETAQRTRLKIPLLQTEEGTHGAMFPGATIFPEGLAIGSSWDMDLVRAIYAAAAQEARAVGIHQLCTLVIEPNRDPRLGRNAEGFTEDPYLSSRIAQEIVRGGQGDGVSANDKVVTVLCHYPGQSQPTSGGLEAGSMEISERNLRDTFLIPWVAGIKKAGALGVMATYPDIDGVPTHSSEKLLTQILREELGFKGLVLSEGGGIGSLIWHQIVATQKEAGAMALKAGIDVDISYEPAYMKPLIENVEEGRVPMALVDRAVHRVLEQKFRLGLFDQPYVDVDRAVAVLHSKEHQDLALRAAREGIVLLKNEKRLLPLRKDVKSIAIIGPNADAAINQLGDYSPVHNGPAALKDLPHIVTVREGITGRVSKGTRVLYAKGCGVLGDDKSEFADAIRAAKNAEVAIVAVGEQFGKPEGTDSNSGPTDGEGHDVASLDLTGVQEDLIRAVYETGTPTVVVLINGRPLSIRWIAEHVPAIVEAWTPGERGGEGVADVLFGDYNPAGRLVITVPRHVGQLPVYYNYKPSKAYRTKPHPGPDIAGPDTGVGYVDLPATPLYEFGYGLSYTQFRYSSLRISPTQIHPAGIVQVSVDIKNIGEREGVETVQVYIHHITGSVTTPVKGLRSFERVALRPLEEKTVSFTLTNEDFALLNRDMHWVVEPGEIEIMIGKSSEDMPLKGVLRITE